MERFLPICHLKCKPDPLDQNLPVFVGRLILGGSECVTTEHRCVDHANACSSKVFTEVSARQVSRLKPIDFFVVRNIILNHVLHSL